MSDTRRERWWRSRNKEDLVKEAWHWADAVAEANSWDLERNRKQKLLYQRLDPGRHGWTGGPDGRSRFNLVSLCVDTAASLIAQLKPVAAYNTDAGSWELQRVTRARTRVLDNLFMELAVHDIGGRVFYNAAVNDFAATYTYMSPLTGKPAVELVTYEALDIDRDEAMYGNPPTIARRHFMDRTRLKALYGKAWIDDADGPSGDDYARFSMSSEGTGRADLVRILELWHVESAPGEGDGRHVIVTSNGVLHDEELTGGHRFAFYSWKRDLNGSIFGTSIAEEVLDAQARINRHIRKIDELQNLMSGGRVLLRAGTQLKVEKITNFPGQVLTFSGGDRPEWQVTSGTPGDLQAQIDVEVDRTLKVLGLNPSSIQGSREIGINSGEGQRVMQDIKSQRHVMNSRNFIKFYMDMSKNIIDVLDAMADLDPDFTVNAMVARGSTAFLQETKWAELVLPEGKARFYLSDVSATPQTPAGKLETIQDFLRMGFMSRTWALKQLDMPDTGAYNTLETASLEFALWQVEQLSDGIMVYPPDYADLAVCAEVATKSLQFVEMNGAPPEIVWLFRDYIREVDRKLAKATAPVVPPATEPPPSAAPVQGSPV